MRNADSLDATGLQDTVAGQILTHPLTAGVSVLSYGNVNSISGTPAAAGFDGPFLLAKNLTSVWGAAEEIAGGGEVVLLADANLLSHIEDEVGNDNHVLFLNVAPPPAFAVPALGPGTGLWIAVALMTTAAVWRLAGRTVEHAVGSRRG